MQKAALGLLLCTISCVVSAEQITDPKAIERIASTLPASGGSVFTRTRELGITISSISIQRVTVADAGNDPLSRPGDISYSMFTDADQTHQQCNVLGTIVVTRRGDKYIAESRTAS